MHLSLSSPDITAAEFEAVTDVLRSPMLSNGPRVSKFEESFACYTGARHAVAVSSGTGGLHLCVAALNIDDGDIVITTPFSFIASANVVLYERAIPIFVDVDPRTGNIDPSLVSEAVDEITRGSKSARRYLPPKLHGLGPPALTRRLKAILPVHAFGQPADMDTILEAAHRHGLAVVEDACEAIGAQYKGRNVGILGDAGVFSFYPNKQMTLGEGGVIVTNRDDLDGLFRSLRNQGRGLSDEWLHHTRLGYNYRLDEMSAALGLVQLGRIEELLAKRERVAQWYNQRLRFLESVEIPFMAPTTTRMSWFVYVVHILSSYSRDLVIERLAERGIPSRPYFLPIHLQPFYVERFGYQRGHFPVAERLGDTCLALPFSSVMTEAEVDYVCSNLEAILY